MCAAMHPPNLAGLVLCAGFVTNPIRAWSLPAKVFVRPLSFRLSPPDLILEHFLIGADAPPALTLAVRQAVHCVSPTVLARRGHAVLGCDAGRDLTPGGGSMLYI